MATHILEIPYERSKTELRLCHMERDNHRYVTLNLKRLLREAVLTSQQVSQVQEEIEARRLLLRSLYTEDFRIKTNMKRYVARRGGHVHVVEK